MQDAQQILDVGLRAGFTRDAVRRALGTLDDEETVRLAWMMSWVKSRHEHQVEPEGKWQNWMIMAGRGAGKTRVGAEWTGMHAALQSRGTKDRSLVAAPTQSDVQDVCIEGDSGLLSVIPSCLVKDYNKNKHRIILSNGALIGGIAAETPTRFRGPQWHRAWCDELAAWGETGRCDPQEAWDLMSMSVRLGSGDDARILVTTTPKNKPHVKALLKEDGTVVTGASTHVNLSNLSPAFRKRILKYDGTAIGRQEIYAELIDSEDGGIIRRKWLQMWPANKALPKFEYIVMSLDTSYGSEAWQKKKQLGDPSACSVWGCFRHKSGDPGIMLLDCWAEHLGLPDLVDKVKAERRAKYGDTDSRPLIQPIRGPKAIMGVGKGVDIILIEEKASGKSLRQYLAKAGIVTQGFNPGVADKRTRTHMVSPIASNGIIWVPESNNRPGKFMSWAEPLVEQVCSYAGEGTTVHDDLLDTFTQALRLIDWQWLHYLEQAAKRKKGSDVDLREKQMSGTGQRRNPYSQ